MKTSEFDYHLPPELIAQEPASRRDGSRMLVVHRETGALEHKDFHDLPSFLRKGDRLVLNNTRVYPARAIGHKEKTGGRVELLFLEAEGPEVWSALLRASRRPAVGDWIVLADGEARVEVLEQGEQGRVTLRVEANRPVIDVLEDHGLVPLPPYIKRAPDAERSSAFDHERYQTVYARETGAIAAPTAGLHFTPELLESLKASGVPHSHITLHVGIGTFRPVSVERVDDHTMESERYQIEEAAAQAIAETRRQGGRIVAVGSTVVRTLETVASEHGGVVATEGRTTSFIRPPYQSKAVDAVITNFHLPRSTLLMMMCALAGYDLIMRAYTEAVQEKYRFYSYGDCMLIL